MRVLEKGDGEEGTRVVKNAGRNHFEPLRTALGGFVGETNDNNDNNDNNDEVTTEPTNIAALTA